ncbi:MAG: C40 family peptidase [Lachnospiraceae bacterium]|nr:C40 family peptidase [Lachnospiraceae bacterium]
MKTWDEAIKKGLLMFDHKEKYAYFYGAKGELLTDEIMYHLISAYPDHFAKIPNLIEIMEYSRGKYGFDCSGFITFLTGDPGYSGAQIANCHDVTTNLAAGPAGSLLYTTFGGKGSHIGIDIGYGFFLMMSREGETVQFGKISEYPWEKSGQSKYLNMEGSDSR